MTARVVPIVSLLVLGVAVARAEAHTVLTAPEPRVTGMPGSSLKARPCGRGPDEQRSTTVTTFHAGETITVSWHETIPHPGYWRVSFDDDGQDFVDPPEPRATDYSDLVLADVIYPSTPAEAAERWGKENLYSYEVTLPDVACEHCTLQLIQFMEDKLADTNPDNDIYYSCADLVLVKDAAEAVVEAVPDVVEADTAETTPNQMDAAAPAPEVSAAQTDGSDVSAADAVDSASGAEDGAKDAGGGCYVAARPVRGTLAALLLGLALPVVARRRKPRLLDS